MATTRANKNIADFKSKLIGGGIMKLSLTQRVVGIVLVGQQHSIMIQIS
jgi:hypothetical protein